MRSNRDFILVNLRMSRNFVELIDRVAKLTGSTRSDLIRRAVEYYIAELKKSNLITDLEERLREVKPQ